MKKPEDIRILVGCEESQAVTIAFRERGFQAFSCDILPESGGHPEWHYQQDIFEVIKMRHWDCMIAFPPCTHLAVSGARWFPEKRADGRQQQGIDFFMAMINAPIERIAVENPTGIMSKIYRKPDQIIQPYYFGDEAQKSTCLWLKNLPPLFHAKEPDLFNDKITHVGRGEMTTFESGCTMPKWYADAWRLSPDERARIRSKTFPGFAQAMATQWGDYLINNL